MNRSVHHRDHYGQDMVARYEEWFKTPTGRFALTQERRLVQRLISDWPRRAQKLLDIGCGTGLFLKLFHKAGFDVTGVDFSPHMLEASRTRLGKYADLHMADATNLPFLDKEFDFTSLITVLELVEDPEAVLKEAFRVTRKGMLIAFLNKFSFYHFPHFLKKLLKSKNTLAQANFYTPFSMRAMVRNNLGRYPTVSRSVLPGPKWTWRRTIPLRWMNSFILPSMLGSYCVLKIDLLNEKPLSPLYSFKTHTSCN